MQKEDAYDQMQGDGSAGDKKEVLQDVFFTPFTIFNPLLDPNITFNS